MTNRSIRLLLTTTAAVCVLFSWTHPSEASDASANPSDNAGSAAPVYTIVPDVPQTAAAPLTAAPVKKTISDQGYQNGIRSVSGNAADLHDPGTATPPSGPKAIPDPRAVTDNNFDPRRLSEAGKAAEVNNVVPQSNVPGFGNQTGDQHDPNMDIPGINLSNTPGTGTPLSGPKGIPGIDTVNGGAASLNLPGSSFQHSPDDIDKVTSQMSQEAQGIVDKATQGGPNSLNIPTSSSAPGVREADGDGFFSTVWNAVTGFFAGLFSDPKGDPQSANTNAKGTSSSELHPNPYGPDEPSENTTPASKGTSTSELHSNPYGPDDPSMNAKPAGGNKGMPGLHPNPYKDPNPEDSGSASAVGTTQLSPNSAIAKKDYGGGTGNNSETSSGPVGPLAPGSSFARKSYGDGSGDDPGDNNNHTKAGGLASGTSFARRGNGDGGGSDNRGSSSGNAKATGKPRGPGGNNQLGNADSKVVGKSRVIGAGLLEGDSGFTAQGPSAAGTVARSPGGTAAIAGHINSH